MTERNYGHLTEAAIGSLMKEVVRRVILRIKAKRFSFDAKVKRSYDGDMDDLVTDADAEAQATYVKLLKEWFPGFGIIAEESELSVPCELPGIDLYFTVDPLDGTKAFGRRQSTGVGTMLGLVCNGVVIAAYVGDVMTGEIFGYRPGSEKAHWITTTENAVPLGPNLNKPLREQYVVLRDPIEDYTPQMRRLVKPGEVFKSYEIGGGSIGIMFTRLWRGEVGGIVLAPSWETPWDMTPVVGITKRLGFDFYELDGGRLLVVRIPLAKQRARREKEVVVVHSHFSS